MVSTVLALPAASKSEICLPLPPLVQPGPALKMYPKYPLKLEVQAR